MTICFGCGARQMNSLYSNAWLFDHFMPIVGDPTGSLFGGVDACHRLCSADRAPADRVDGDWQHLPPSSRARQYGCDRRYRLRGRLDLGIGAGWNEREHHAYGIPMYTTGERIRRLGEACEVIRLMWTEFSPPSRVATTRLRMPTVSQSPSRSPIRPL